jgi:ParB-like nuclease domain.
MKKHCGGITSYLNQTTQKAIEQSVVLNQIIEIDINLLETNNSNFYGLRDLESLAGMIATSGYINPLEVKQLENGKYKIISGHRRHAALSMLIENGERIDLKIPCIVRDFEPKGPLSADEIERCYLIFSNRGQRQYRTVSEKLEEVRLLEPIARKIWESERKTGYIEGNFRSYFSNELNMSATSLQRLLSLNKLIPKALEAVDAQVITETTAAKLATLSEEEQHLYLTRLEDGEITGKLRDIEQMIDHSKKEDVSNQTNSTKNLNSDEAPTDEISNKEICSENERHTVNEDAQKSSFIDERNPSENELEKQGQEKLFQQTEGSFQTNESKIADEEDVKSEESEGTTAAYRRDNSGQKVMQFEPIGTEETSKNQMQDILPKFDDADKEADSWVLHGLSEMMEQAIKMIALEKANHNEKSAAQWDVRRAKVALVMAVLNE